METSFLFWLPPGSKAFSLFLLPSEILKEIPISWGPLFQQSGSQAGDASVVSDRLAYPMEYPSSCYMPRGEHCRLPPPNSSRSTHRG